MEAVPSRPILLAVSNSISDDVRCKLSTVFKNSELIIDDPLDENNCGRRISYSWGFIYVPTHLDSAWINWSRNLFRSKVARNWIAMLEDVFTVNEQKYQFLSVDTMGYIQIFDALSDNLFSAIITPWELNTTKKEVSLGALVGRSASIARVNELIVRFSKVDSPVILSGETGTGKELIARELHRRSHYCQGPFIALNCGAIPDELFEAEMFGYVAGAFTDAKTDREGWLQKAHKGTLFLDEIAELSLRSQAKLLRVLERKAVTPIGTNQSFDLDVRIVAASHVDLRQAIVEKRFREDLFYRLDVLHIQAPPLRERSEDILLLASNILRQLCNELNLPVRQICFESLFILTSYTWPGNVRELINKLKQICILSDALVLEAKHLEIFGLPTFALNQFNSVPLLDTAISRAELNAVAEALSATGDNISASARLLGVSRMTLYRLIRKHKIIL